MLGCMLCCAAMLCCPQCLHVCLSSLSACVYLRYLCVYVRVYLSLHQAEAGEVRRMLEEASAQVAQQAEELTKLGSDSDEKAAELKSAQAQLSTAIASLDTANADLAEQTELISSLKVENTGEK